MFISKGNLKKFGLNFDLLKHHRGPIEIERDFHSTSEGSDEGEVCCNVRSIASYIHLRIRDLNYQE